MNHNKFLIIMLIASAGIIAGCARESMRADFGTSYQTNLASQVINPEAANQTPATQTVDGQKLEQATARYRADKQSSKRDKLLSDIGE